MSTAATIEHLFRQESARLTAVLVRLFGSQNLELVEDVMQESFLAALTTWGREGTPANPAGWLLTVCRNKAIDVVRRERLKRSFAPDFEKLLESEWTASSSVESAFEEDDLRDDQLRMIFMCCREDITEENRLPLILRTVCGFSVPAISRALLTPEATINKRLFRTRKRFEEVPFSMPVGDALTRALSSVQTVLYLLFNEGYLSTGSAPIAREFCEEAIGLTTLIAEHDSLANSETFALLALMRFHFARLDARVDDQGRPVPLDTQDRSLESLEEIAAGQTALARALELASGPFGERLPEAAIAGLHCAAESFAETDWNEILRLYDLLVERTASPVAVLNRAVARCYVEGAEPAIAEVEALRDSGRLSHGNSVESVLANLYARAGRKAQARRSLSRALAGAPTEHERYLIKLQFDRLTSP